MVSHPFLVTMIFAVNTSHFQKLHVSRIISVETVLFRTIVRMPVYCIAYGCDNDSVMFQRL